MLLRSIGVVLLVLALLACGKSGTTQPPRSPVIQALEKKITLGMSRPDVEKILAGAGVQYGWSDKERQFGVVVHDVYKKGFVSYGEQLIVYMDEEEKVAKIEVKTFGDGP